MFFHAALGDFLISHGQDPSTGYGLKFMVLSMVLWYNMRDAPLTAVYKGITLSKVSCLYDIPRQTLVEYHRKIPAPAYD